MSTFAPGVAASDVSALERQAAARALLRRPLLTPDSRHRESFLTVRRHARWLERWFAENLGYRLVVDGSCVRLEKRPLSHPRVPRGLQRQNGTPFDRRRYAILALAYAAMDRGEAQTTVSLLSEDVRLLATGVPGLDLEFDRRTDRRAFVDALHAAMQLGFVHRQDGDEEGFVNARGGGDALLRVRHRRLSLALACPRPPSSLDSPEELWREQYADTGRGSTRRTRHRLMRRLVEEPVVYFDDLSDEEAEYLRLQRNRVFSWLADGTGMSVETRSEGIVVIDETGEASDTDFSARGTTDHATLLLAMHLAREARAGRTTFSTCAAQERLRALAADHAHHWRAEVSADEAALVGLRREVLERLEALQLVRRANTGWTVLPGIARFVPQEDEAAEAE